LLSFETVASKLLAVVAMPLHASLSGDHGDKVGICLQPVIYEYLCHFMYTDLLVHIFQVPASSVVESSGKFLVSRMTELSLAASHEEVCLCVYHNLSYLFPKGC